MKDRQCLGRLFRVGQNPAVVVAPPSIEADLVAKIQQKVILLGSVGESTGVSFHKDEGLDLPQISDSL